MDQIAFFWRGEDTTIPEYFVQSIKIRNLKSFKIIQVSDTKTKKIEGVDLLIDKDLPKDLMSARLKAFSLIETQNTNTIFCDADSLLINNFNFLNFSPGYYLMKREGNFIINHLFPEYYPEFKNKFVLDVMPFLFGAIIISKKENFFINLFKICNKLPPRFHRWYGDQLSLHIFYLDNKSKFSFFNQKKYMHIVGRKDKDQNIDLHSLQKKGVVFLTFKGLESKKRIAEVLENIKKLL